MPVQPTSIKFACALLSYLLIYQYLCKQCTSIPCGTGKRRLGVGGHALMSGCLEH